MSHSKFAAIVEGGAAVPHAYDDVFYRQPCGDTHRLVVGPADQHIAVLCDLARTFTDERYYLLYVLVAAVGSQPEGRYESPVIASFKTLELFLWSHQTFLEQDGRHHLWVGSPTTSNLLVYDNHNIIYAYGDLPPFVSTLWSRGYREAQFPLPLPHAHGYQPAAQDLADDLHAGIDWRHLPLAPGDE